MSMGEIAGIIGATVAVIGLISSPVAFFFKKWIDAELRLINTKLDSAEKEGIRMEKSLTDIKDKQQDQDNRMTAMENTYQREFQKVRDENSKNKEDILKAVHQVSLDVRGVQSDLRNQHDAILALANSNNK